MPAIREQGKNVNSGSGLLDPGIDRGAPLVAENVPGILLNIPKENGF